MAQITLTIKSTSESFSLNDWQLVYVVPYYIDDVESGSNITVIDTASADTLVRTVSETPDEIAVLTDTLVQITLTSRETPYIAIYRIKDIITNGSVADIIYDGSGNVTQKLNTSMTTAQILEAIQVGSNEPKVYIALLSQSGTDEPTAIILKNTLGEVPVWSYDSTGYYYITSSGLFTENKTAISISSNGNTSALQRTIVGAWEDESNISIQTGNNDSLVDVSNGYLSNTLLTIEVYP